MLTVRLAELAQVRRLQLEVLRPHGPLPDDRPMPAAALHVGAFEGSGDVRADVVGADVVGAASVLAARWPGPGPLAQPTWQLRSMAVRADHRGSGVGRRVLDLAVATALARGAGGMWAAARLGAVGFYTAAGWSVVGPQWIKPGVGPHRYVILTAPSLGLGGEGT